MFWEPHIETLPPAGLRALQWQRDQLARQQQEIERAQTETVKFIIAR